jgi:hypothetical protein
MKVAPEPNSVGEVPKDAKARPWFTEVKRVWRKLIRHTDDARKSLEPKRRETRT